MTTPSLQITSLSPTSEITPEYVYDEDVTLSSAFFLTHIVLCSVYSRALPPEDDASMGFSAVYQRVLYMFTRSYFYFV